MQDVACMSACGRLRDIITGRDKVRDGQHQTTSPLCLLLRCSPTARKFHHQIRGFLSVSTSTLTGEASVASHGRACGVMSEVSSSSYPGSAGDKCAMDAEEEEEEEELELGLSVGTKKGAGCGGRRAQPLRGEYCRILTAEDLSSMGSRASPSPLSSSSSVSSSCSPTTAQGSGGDRESRKAAATTLPSQTVVGWPPIRVYRMNNLLSQSKDNTFSHSSIITVQKKALQNINDNQIKESICCKEIKQKGRFSVGSLFVKVNMDGDPIGRKVNLKSHFSYETLARALEVMFFNLCTIDGSRKPKLLDGSSGFSLTYEDKDGDWMLLGDVPWGMFLNTVKRIRIMRTSDARGLAPRPNSFLNAGRD